MLKWLQKELSYYWLFHFIFFIVFIDLIYAFSIAWALNALRATSFLYVQSNSIISLGTSSLWLASQVNLGSQFMPRIVLLYALYEEMIYRFPLGYAAVKMWSHWRYLYFFSLKPWMICILAVILSLLFGWMHGSLINILVQGVLGLTFCITFLKCGGFQGHTSKAIFASTSVHFLYNFSLIILGSK